MHERTGERGFALITMLILLALLMAMLLTHFALTWIEMSTTRSSMNSFIGFYAAEAGLNIRAEQVRQTFVGYAQPAGASPATTDPCEGTNLGSGDFACEDYAFQGRNVMTYVRETTGSNLPMVVPRGETYGNLHGLENHYAVYSTASNESGLPEAVLEVHFMSRDIPLFQFAAFYDKDLEILPASATTIEGPIHTNGDLYLATSASIDITHPVTVAGRLYSGRKDADACLDGAVRVNDPDDLTALPVCDATRSEIPQTYLTSWNQMVNVEVNPLTVPPPAMLDPVAGSTYWDRADLRVVLDLDTGEIQVRDAAGADIPSRTASLTACGSAVHSTTFTNRRESLAIDMLDISLQSLINCVHSNTLMGGGKGLDDATDGGLVWHFSVVGPDAAVPNNYGVRVSNGSSLAGTVIGAPAIRGLTLATDQALYVLGDYNTVGKKPAALLGDSFNVLSGAWNDANSTLDLDTRTATDTTINAALLAGTDSTGGAEGDAGQDAGGYNGGLEQFVRLHEDWTGDTLALLGSLVSLSTPRHVDGALVTGDPYFLDPARNWVYEDQFDDPELLPPLPPTFVYLKQELFVRRFEL